MTHKPRTVNLDDEVVIHDAYFSAIGILDFSLLLLSIYADACLDCKIQSVDTSLYCNVLTLPACKSIAILIMRRMLSCPITLQQTSNL